MTATIPAPPAPPARLYLGQVMHHRLQPVRHRFTQRVCTLLVDIDRLMAIADSCRLLSVNHFNLIAIHDRDHGARDGTPLRPWVEHELALAGLEAVRGRILLLAMPRFLGYVFNPLSIYFCHDATEQLRAIVYEVKNTFRGQHAYVLPVEDGQEDETNLRQTCAKNFYVSPFIEADATYRFSLRIPDRRLSVVIREEVKGEPLLNASLTGIERPLTDRMLLAIAKHLPFSTHRVMAGIHWEAFRLWLKGMRPPSNNT
ncbi:MAG: DUF1365 domain-containing protein [Alphaproteobacteria bacterium]|nr:DUF1365 domain-containing protein [Alphaproteobacteria bacterium]